MPEDRIRQIIIVGGGTAGWMTAAALSRIINTRECSIRLIESDQIATVGVGEATIPAIHDFIRRLGIDEKDLMRKTNATWKLGIEFLNWNKIGDAYIHPFGTYGQDMNGVGFHHYWLKQRKRGDTSAFNDYSLPWVATRLGRFDYPLEDRRSVLATYAYAFHFDASLFASYLRRYAEKLGVVRTEGLVVDVALRPEDGFIESLQLASGENITGELFIDCSGFRALLIEDALKTSYEDWRHWLPCDRAFAVGSDREPNPPSHTLATAHDAGWQWRIPLQNRTGNGHVFSSEYMSEDAARQILLDNINSAPHAEPLLLKFTAGKRKKTWNRNCVAIGLSGGFLEPLESTSIFLIQEVIMKLIEFFPDRNFPTPDTDEFNRQIDAKFEQIRNFIILHYKATQRDDTPFWNYCRTMSVPDELAYRMQLFRDRGLAVHSQSELFIETNWIAIYLGQGIIPSMYDPRVDCLDEDHIAGRLAQMKAMISSAAEALPTHASSIARYCAAKPEPS